MAFTTPGTAVAGEVLTAAFWNEQVRDQLDVLAPFFSAWTSYTPTIDQGANTNIATTAKAGRYLKVGRLIIIQATATMNGSGVAGNAVTVSLPAGITINAIGFGRCGYAHIFDQSTATRYAGIAEIFTGRIGFVGDWSGAALWGSLPNIAIAASDQIDFTFISSCDL
jgi:hypothetical protein